MHSLGVLWGGCVSEFTLLLQGCIDSVKINTPPPWKKEWHIYTQCSIINQFWDLAAQWFRSEIDKDLPRILLNNTKVFGFWNENPNDLSNIFLRSARYTIFKGRHIGVIPQVETLIPTVLDDLSKKYQKGRWKKYEGKPSEWRAIAFVRKRRGWSDVNPKWLPSE